MCDTKTCIRCELSFDPTGGVYDKIREHAVRHGREPPELKVCALCLLVAIDEMCEADEPEPDEVLCTPTSARWCPRCGDCTCPENDSGDWLSSDDCPLHDPMCDHGERVDPEYA
jgi:hypothetical protein